MTAPTPPAPTAPPSPASRALSVRQVNTMIKGALEQVLPPRLWVVGEVMGHDRNKHRQHLYFDLAEKDSDTEKIAARLGVVLFAGKRQAIERRLAQAGAGALADGVRVCLLGKLEMYVPTGMVQLIVEDVDPAFTLGDLLRQRRELLEKLRREGVLEENKKRPLGLCPLRIGLVTSVGSAAYEDFTTTLRGSGYGFKILAVDARMQGQETPRQVSAALRRLSRPDLKLDAIVICRGGGGQADLSWFDHEAVARAILACPLPVITGIGHTTDQSVADLVAHYAAVTPTDAANWLAARVSQFDQTVADLARRLARHSRQRLHTLATAHHRRAQGLLIRAGRQLQHRRERLLQLPGHWRLALARRLGTLAATQEQIRRRLPQALPRTHRQETATLLRQRERLGMLLPRHRHLATGPAWAAGQSRRLTTALDRRLAAAAALPAPALARLLDRRLSAESQKLAQKHQVVMAHDPLRRLKQGYALLKDKKGGLLRTRADILAQAVVVAQVSDGQVRLKPERTGNLFDTEE